MMMSEDGYVEAPVLEWLTGKSGDALHPGLGWKYCDARELEAFDRPSTDPLVEGLLIPAISRINSTVQNDAQARMAVDALRRVMRLPDLLDANRSTLEALRDGVPVSLTPGAPATTIRFIEFDPTRQNLNDFTATNQYKVKGIKGVKADTVLLVNGIPIVVAEYKSYINSGHDWTEGVNQVHRYQREAPLLLASNVFCVAADEQEFRYGTVAYQINNQQDIDLQRDEWKPWLSQYPVQRMYWTLPTHQQDSDPVHAAVTGLLRPDNVLDYLAHFVVFETKKGKTAKKVARYQQFEAANDIVNRALELVGRRAKHQDRTGLVWHTQGSGKSLTMIYAANKLRRHPNMQNPTVMIVVDRRDLKTQLGDDFDACDYPNVAKALGVEDLKAKIRTDRRETIITTVQSFQRMNDLEPNRRDNIIMLIDEAHRSQKGRGSEGFAITMRAKLPEAFRFGLTGTPIDRTMVNTHRDFGPIRDGKQERYLSYYGIRQSIRDGATLEVYYEYRKVPLTVNERPLDTGFEQMCEQMEVESEAEKDFLQRREARWKALARDPRRVKKVISNLVEHFLAYPDPSGFKAQLVAIDRKACSIYKDALDQELRQRGLPTEWSDVVISDAQNDPPELERFHYSKDKTDELIDFFKLTPQQWKAWNIQRHGNDEAQYRPPLKILIVCDRLLTGFDAPIEQVMYLDKPLRDHNLLQAMARTNRPFPVLGKRNGLIIDYFGVFQDLQKALNFDESIREEAIINWDRLKEQFPIELQRGLDFFAGIQIEDTRDCLLACLRRIADPGTAHEFEAQYKRTEVLWEAISPDESLYPHRRSYAWLSSIYVAHIRRSRRSPATHAELAAKTRLLIQQNTTFMQIAEDTPIYKIDADYLTRVRELPTPADRAAELEAALNRELTEGNGFLYQTLGKRLKRVVETKDNSDQVALQWLNDLEGIVDEINQAQSEPERLGLNNPYEYGLFTVIRSFAKVQDEALWVQAACSMVAELNRKQYLPNGWPDNAGGQKKVRLTLQIQSWEPAFETLELCPAEEDASPFLQAAVDELARVHNI